MAGSSRHANPEPASMGVFRSDRHTAEDMRHEKQRSPRKSGSEVNLGRPSRVSWASFRSRSPSMAVEESPSPYVCINL
jgi:hypothetical protein